MHLFLTAIVGYSSDGDVVQFKLHDELWLVRLHAWTRYEGSITRSQMMAKLLTAKKVPEIPLIASCRTKKGPREIEQSDPMIDPDWSFMDTAGVWAPWRGIQ